MKKILTTASLAALGAATVHAQQAPGLTPVDRAKPWSVSASLRGFYDDNYVTRSKEFERDSYGVEVSPSVGLNWSMDRTLIGLSYLYSLKYYEDRNDNRADHSHQFNGKLSHAFSERHKMDLSDSFVISQEPTIVDPSGPVTAPIRLRDDADVLRNHATASLTTELSRLFSLALGYSNTLYDYDEEGPGQRSAVLDRMEHLAHINFRWHAAPTTIALFGYQFGAVEHTSDDSLLGPGEPFVDAEARDNRSHYFYVGGDHSFNPNLNASIRLGAQYTEYHHSLPGADNDDWSPYADASASWTYNPGSYVQLGLRHARNQTDVAFPLGGTVPTLEQQSTTVYGTVVHRITPKLRFLGFGQFQNSEFQDGAVDDESDKYFLAGLNLTYQFNQYLSAETGYNYDRLDSDVPGRSFTRNRVYIGIRATY